MIILSSKIVTAFLFPAKPSEFAEDGADNKLSSIISLLTCFPSFLERQNHNSQVCMHRTDCSITTRHCVSSWSVFLELASDTPPLYYRMHLQLRHHHAVFSSPVKQSNDL